MNTKLFIPDGSTSEITELIQDGLIELVEAYRLSQDCRSPPIEFAIEISRLHRLGVNDSHLRWLLKKDLLRHAIETSLVTNSQRWFHENCGPIFNENSCFFLTGNGFNLFFECAGDLCENPLERACPSADRLGGAESHPEVQPVPVWNADRQELRYVGELVKRYKLPSKNQIAILNSFQEDGWPVRIDDPLPQSPGVDSRRKLNDTVKALNNNQKKNWLRFRSDGTGEGITWEVKSCKRSSRTQS